LSTLTSNDQTCSQSQRSDTLSISDRSLSIPSIREPTIEEDIPEEGEAGSASPSQHSPKSPLPKYLSGFRRLTGSSGSRRSSSYMPGAYPRDSISVSSDDSSPVATPPDSAFDVSVGGHSRRDSSSGFGIAWPSVSPKKSGSGVSRSSSFADKLFNRSRTKSNVSATSDKDSRSMRSYRLSNSSKSSQNQLDARNPRPASWVPSRDSSSEFSISGSVFDNDIFDAFPSVPQTLPPAPTTSNSYLSPQDYPAVGRSSTLPANMRKCASQRLSVA